MLRLLLFCLCVSGEVSRAANDTRIGSNRRKFHSKSDYNDLQHYLVIIEELYTLDKRCGGIMVSTKVVMTTCSCVGLFINMVFTYFKLTQIRVVLNPLDIPQERTVKKVGVHVLCSPSLYSQYLFLKNFGVLILKSEFNIGGVITSSFPLEKATVPQTEESIINCRTYKIVRINDLDEITLNLVTVKPIVHCFSAFCDDSVDNIFYEIKLCELLFEAMYVQRYTCLTGYGKCSSTDFTGMPIFCDNLFLGLGVWCTSNSTSTILVENKDEHFYRVAITLGSSKNWPSFTMICLMNFISLPILKHL